MNVKVKILPKLGILSSYPLFLDFCFFSFSLVFFTPKALRSLTCNSYLGIHLQKINIRFFSHFFSEFPFLEEPAYSGTYHEFRVPQLQDQLDQYRQQLFTSDRVIFRKDFAFGYFTLKASLSQDARWRLLIPVSYHLIFISNVHVGYSEGDSLLQYLE